MTVLEWSGEIGWELWTPELRAQLKASKGDDLTIRFSSVGGSIFEGGDIFNLLADHRRDHPSIKMNLEIKSTALSMGSAIAASPVFDDVSVEQTSMFMLHNPWTIAMGDFDEMQSSADFLKSARDMFSRIYSAKSKQSIEDTIKAMSAETWFFGQEIIDAGFADRMNESVSSADPSAGIVGIGQDKALILAAVKIKFQQMKKRQKELNEGIEFDEERAVACLKGSSNTKIVSKSKDGTNNSNNPEDLTVKTKAELIKELPEVYDECVQDGVEKGLKDGVKMERERVKKLADMKAQDNYKNIPEVVAVIDKAMIEGDSLEDATTKMNAAMVTIMNDPAKARAAAQESPGNIQGGDQNIPVMKTDRITEV